MSFPMDKEQILSLGLKFQDNLQQTRGQTTLKDIPDSINDITNSILDEVLECTKCSRNYKIIPNELAFYKKWNIPIPRNCFFCRLQRRFSIRTPSYLWHRKCMCDKKHSNHQGQCEIEFETAYAPDRPEIVYCEKCYQAEVY